MSFFISIFDSIIFVCAGKDYPTFGSNILCKINPTNPGCGGGGRSGGGGNGGGNGVRKKNNNGQGGRRAGSTQNRSSPANAPKAPKAPKAPRAQNGRPRKNQRLPRQKPSSNDDLLAEIAAGNIPGTAGKVKMVLKVCTVRTVNDAYIFKIVSLANLEFDISQMALDIKEFCNRSLWVFRALK